MTAPLAPARGVERALEAAGARRLKPGHFAVDRSGRLVLRCRRLTSEWLRWESRPFALAPGVAAGGLGAQEPAPPGPFKVLASAEPSRLRLAADLPLALERSASPALPVPPLDDELARLLGDGAGDSSGPADSLVVWAEDLVRSVRLLGLSRSGSSDALATAQHQPAPAAVERRLADRGYKVSRLGGRADGILRVQLEPSRLPHHAVVTLREGRGLAVELKLADTAGWAEPALSALRGFAREMNEHLRLVRLVRRGGDGPRPFVAEVELGRLHAGSGWLEFALDALRAAAAFCAEEVQALGSNAELANLVLLAARSRSAATKGGAV